MDIHFLGVVNDITYLTGGTASVVGSVAANVDTSTIRIWMTWEDETATETMNDLNDTTIATAATPGKAVVQVNVVFEQQTN